MKLTPVATTRETARERCGQVLRATFLGERCGEMVSHVCDACGASVCWLHTLVLEQKELCPACAERYREHSMVALRSSYLAASNPSDTAKRRALLEALVRAAKPVAPRRASQLVAFLHRLWWRIWG